MTGHWRSLTANHKRPVRCYGEEGRWASACQAALPTNCCRRFFRCATRCAQISAFSYLQDDSLDAYIAETQRAATDMREALEQRNFAIGISEVYYRKFSLQKTKSEYVWLGDYPKEAERRKRGFPTPVRAS